MTQPIAVRLGLSMKPVLLTLIGIVVGITIVRSQALGQLVETPRSYVERIYEDHQIPGVKRVVKVHLKKPAPQSIVRELAKMIRADNRNFRNIFIQFMLPEHDVGVWAYAAWAPRFKLTIFGLTPKQIDSLKSIDAPRGDKFIGSWLYRGLPGHRMTIYERGQKTLIHKNFPDGSIRQDELVNRKNTDQGIRYEEKQNEHGEFWILNSIGDLEIWDGDGHMWTAKRFD